MSLFEIGVLSIIIFICVYALTDRICNCIEHCVGAKLYAQFMSGNEKPDVGVRESGEVL